MSTRFSLLHRLQNEEVASSSADKPIISYQEYVVEVSGTNTTVLIPTRECELFEQSIEKFEELDKEILQQLLRTHRGVRG